MKLKKHAGLLAVMFVIIGFILGVFGITSFAFDFESNIDADTVKNIRILQLDKWEQVNISTVKGCEWFSFTPEESGVYHFFAEGDLRNCIGCYELSEDGKTYSYFDGAYGYYAPERNFEFNKSLTAGTTYYFQLSLYYDDETGGFSFMVEKNKKIVSVDNISSDPGVAGYYCSGQSDIYMSVGNYYVDFTYEDGSKGKMAFPYRLSTRYDEYLNKITINTSELMENAAKRDLEVPGKYYVDITVTDVENKEVLKKGPCLLEIQSVADAEKNAIVLKNRETNNIMDSYGASKIYKFTAPNDGIFCFTRITESDYPMVAYMMVCDADNNIFKGKPGGKREFNKDVKENLWNLKAGNTYYFLISSNGNEKIKISEYVVSVDVSEVKMQERATLKYGEKLSLYPTLSYAPANATNPAITWRSSNNAVAKVDRGMVRAVGYGTASITASINGKTAVCKITVPVPKKNTTFVSGKATYRITKAGTKNGRVTFVKTSSKSKKISIPKTVKSAGITYKVTAISASALKNNKRVTSLSIGAYVSKIGKNAFYGCNKLKTIKITSKKLKEKSVGANAFKGIYAKARIKVPKSKLRAYKKLLIKKGIGKRAVIKK